MVEMASNGDNYGYLIAISYPGKKILSHQVTHGDLKAIRASKFGETVALLATRFFQQSYFPVQCKPTNYVALADGDQ